MATILLLALWLLLIYGKSDGLMVMESWEIDNWVKSGLVNRWNVNNGVELWEISGRFYIERADVFIIPNVYSTLGISTSGSDGGLLRDFDVFPEFISLDKNI